MHSQGDNEDKYLLERKNNLFFLIFWDRVLCVDLAVLVLALRPASNSKRSSCLYLPKSGIKGIHPHHLASKNNINHVLVTFLLQWLKTQWLRQHKERRVYLGLWFQGTWISNGGSEAAGMGARTANWENITSNGKGLLKPQSLPQWHTSFRKATPSNLPNNCCPLGANTEASEPMKDILIQNTSQVI